MDYQQFRNIEQHRFSQPIQNRSLVTQDISGAQSKQLHQYMDRNFTNNSAHQELMYLLDDYNSPKRLNNQPEQINYGRKRYWNDLLHVPSQIVPQGVDFFQRGGKKHYDYDDGEIKNFKALENRHDIPLPLSTQYDRALYTNDIEGTKPGTLISKVVKNKQTAQRLKNSSLPPQQQEAEYVKPQLQQQLPPEQNLYLALHQGPHSKPDYNQQQRDQNLNEGQINQPKQYSQMFKNTGKQILSENPEIEEPEYQPRQQASNHMQPSHGQMNDRERLYAMLMQERQMGQNQQAMESAQHYQEPQQVEQYIQYPQERQHQLGMRSQVGEEPQRYNAPQSITQYPRNQGFKVAAAQPRPRPF